MWHPIIWPSVTLGSDGYQHKGNFSYLRVWIEWTRSSNIAWQEESELHFQHAHVLVCKGRKTSVQWMKAYCVTACVCTLIGCITEKYRQVTGFHFNKFSITSLAGFTQSWSPPSGIWKPLRWSCSGVIKLLRPVMSWLAPAMHQELDFQGCKLRCRWPVINNPSRFQLAMSLCFVGVFFITITLQSHHFITPVLFNGFPVELGLSCNTNTHDPSHHDSPFWLFQFSVFAH